MLTLGLIFPSTLVASGLAADRTGSVLQIAFYSMEASACNSGKQTVRQGVSARQLAFLTTPSPGSELRSNSSGFVAQTPKNQLDCATSTEPVPRTHRNVNG